ncbi:MAG: AMP-binding protein [Dehalococcoidia bacterium]|nr:MAG: AMP-binding protein [Dehalococcoidia bacterium]
MARSIALSYSYGASSTPLIGLTIPDYLDRIASRFPGNEALVDVPSGRRWTYAQLRDECRRVAKSLLKLGISRGDRVAIWATNHPEWVLVQFGTAIIGAVLVNVNPAYRTHELEYALRNSEASALVLIERFKSSDYVSMFHAVCPEAKSSQPGRLESEKLPHLHAAILMEPQEHPGIYAWEQFLALGASVADAELDQRQAALDMDDVINIQYTSGTTGMPKGASLTHHNILNNGFFAGEGMKLTEKDRLCIPVPFYHCFGMVLANLACVTHGAAMVLPGESFDAGATLRAVEQERCTALHGVPTMFIAELEHSEFDSFDLTSLRTGIMAGAPCPIEVMKKVTTRMHAAQMTIAYGETEASPMATQTPVDASLEDRTGTVGLPSPHLELKVVDRDTGAIVPCGAQGEICYRGYSIMRGYYNNKQGTDEVIDEAKWLHSGDLATMDERGYCKITGRAKEMIIRGGENIYPREIEEFLFTHPKVRNVQVIGVPDEKYGEEIQAWIELREGETATEDEIRAYCKGKIAHYKIPRYVKFVTEYPMTVTGKIQKYKMREVAVKELGLERAAQTKMA